MAAPTNPIAIPRPVRATPDEGRARGCRAGTAPRAERTHHLPRPSGDAPGEQAVGPHGGKNQRRKPERSNRSRRTGDRPRSLSSRSSIMATRMIGWSLSIAEIARRTAGASAARRPVSGRRAIGRCRRSAIARESYTASDLTGQRHLRDITNNADHGEPGSGVGTDRKTPTDWVQSPQATTVDIDLH